LINRNNYKSYQTCQNEWQGSSETILKTPKSSKISSLHSAGEFKECSSPQKELFEILRSGISPAVPKCAEQYIRTGIFYKAGGIPKSIQPINKANIQIFKSFFQSGISSQNLFTPSFGAASSPHMGLSLASGSAQLPAPVAHHLQSVSPPPAMENNSQNNPAPPSCSTPTSTLQTSTNGAHHSEFSFYQDLSIPCLQPNVNFYFITRHFKVSSRPKRHQLKFYLVTHFVLRQLTQMRAE
jgi:hypothetical protein